MKVLVRNEYAVVPKKLLFDRTLSNDAKVWYIFLSFEHGNKFGTDFAMEHLGMSKERIDAAHKELIISGWITEMWYGDELRV